MLPQHQGDFREIVQAVAEGVDVKHGPACHDQGVVPFGEKTADKVQGVGLIHSGGIVVLDGQVPDKIMPYARELFL